jgi:hypothetical protein
VRQREFDLWRDPWEQDVRELQQWRREHEQDHDDDEDDERKHAADAHKQVVEYQRWNWQRVLAAISAAAAVIAASASAFGK